MSGPTDDPTLAAAFQRTAALAPERIALRNAGDGGRTLTWAQYAAEVRALAGGLAALGVKRGDTVALMMPNRLENSLADTAAMHLGAVPFSIYNTLAPEQIGGLLANAGSGVVIAEARFIEAIRSVAPATLRHVVGVDNGGDMTLADLATTAAPAGFDFDATWRATEPEDLLTLIYTSGTTGPPKGVELTHAALLAQVRMVSAWIPVHPEDVGISFLPSAHIADRWASLYTQHVCGQTVAFLADPTQLAATLAEVRPTVWGAVPRVWEKMKSGLEAAGITDPAALPEAARGAVIARLGLDRLRWALSGAAPIPHDVLEYWLALGVPVCEVWGMSELSCCATVNPPDAIRLGSVGRVLPEAEMVVADDGELLVRAPTLMHGYRDQPEQTAEAIVDGWMHTGDIGRIDEDGYVWIVDRKKEIIINAGGKNMSPAHIESTLKSASPLIGQAVCIGDRRPYNVALIVLDPDALAGRSADDPVVTAEVTAGVEAANAKLARVEQIKYFHVLAEEWLPGGDELTPTMKLRRKPFAAKYASQIDALYEH